MPLQKLDPVWFRLLVSPPLIVDFSPGKWTVDFVSVVGTAGAHNELTASNGQGKTVSISFNFSTRQALEEDVFKCFAVRHMTVSEVIMERMVRDRQAAAMPEPDPLPPFGRGDVWNTDWERRRKEFFAPPAAPVVKCQPQYTTFRLRDPLPVAVNGGRTRWVIFAKYYGKNHVKCCLWARCIDTDEHLEIMNGRNDLEECMRNSGVRVPRGTLLYRIFMKLFHERRAEIIPEGGTMMEAYLFPMPAAPKPIRVQRTWT